MLRVLATGRLREKHWLAAEAAYHQRMKDWWKPSVQELPASARGDARAAKAEEAGYQGKVLEGWTGIIVALSEDGDWAPDSVAFCRQLTAWRDAGKDVAFVIGGACGLDESIKARADRLWALGPLTLPHQMVRAVLAEQLYRAMTIDMGHPYHRV